MSGMNGSGEARTAFLNRTTPTPVVRDGMTRTSGASGTRSRRPRRGRRSAAVLSIAFLALSLVQPFAALAVTTPPPTTSPPTTSPTHLASGSLLAQNTGTVTTSSISPDPAQTVVVFVALATFNGSPSPVPAVAGGEAAWTRVATAGPGQGSPRQISAFVATRVRPGPLRISFPPAMRMDVLWSINQSPGAGAQLGTASSMVFTQTGAINLPSPPRGHTVAGFLIGTITSVGPASPAMKLGQANRPGLGASISSFRSTAQQVRVHWSSAAHWVGIAVELR